MSTILASIILFLCVFALMAVGLIFQKRAISGTCARGNDCCKSANCKKD